MADSGSVHDGVLCLPVLASARAPAEVCSEKAAIASLF